MNKPKDCQISERTHRITQNEKGASKMTKGQPVFSSIAMGDVYRASIQFLNDHHVPDAPQKIRGLMGHCFGLSPMDFVTRPGDVLCPGSMESYLSFLHRLAHHEPLSRVMGHRDFWKHRFIISPFTLDPRWDSETLIEAVLHRVKKPKRILDLGTGSGCLLLSLLHEYPHAMGVGVDRCFDALRVAKSNAKAMDLVDRTHWLHASWTDALNPNPSYDLIVSNPPYIPKDHVQNLDEAVRLYDPMVALSPGPTGLEAYEYLCKAVPSFLSEGGFLVFEIGMGQSRAVTDLGLAQNLQLVEEKSDLSQIPRVVVFQKGVP